MKRKWTLFTFSRGDFKAVERYLNEQAEKGWELERTGILARWKRTERTDLTYCVDLAKPKQEHEERQEYVELCRETGWELTAFSGGMYLFKSMPGARITPIHTDPDLEKKNYNQYYIRNTILGVLFLALYLGFWIFMSAALGRYTDEAAAELRYELMTRWVMVGLIPALPVWAVWALWKIVDFIRAAVQSGAGEIGRSPQWVMWVNCVLSFLVGVGGVLFLLGDVLEILFIADMNSYVLILAVVWGIVCLYRAIAIEKELFKRERRRYIAAGVSLIVVFALLIAGRSLLPYGQWDTNPYSKDEKAPEQYALLESVPIVRGEDIGAPLDEEKQEYFYLTYELTPMGEHWKLENYYRGSGLDSTGCETYIAPTMGIANQLIALKVEEAERSAYLGKHHHDVEVEMERVELNWADEAWYGERQFPTEEVLAVLVVRVGKQVTYLAARTPLMTGELVEMIEGRLCN